MDYYYFYECKYRIWMSDIFGAHITKLRDHKNIRNEHAKNVEANRLMQVFSYINLCQSPLAHKKKKDNLRSTVVLIWIFLL